MLVAIDYFTKWAEAEPLVTIMTRNINNPYGRPLYVGSRSPKASSQTMEGNLTQNLVQVLLPKTLPGQRTSGNNQQIPARYPKEEACRQKRRVGGRAPRRLMVVQNHNQNFDKFTLTYGNELWPS